MANRLTSNPIYFDEFDTDTTLAAPGMPFKVKKIRMLSAAQWDLFLLENFEGEVIFTMENSVGNARRTEVDFGPDGFDFGGPKGVRIDVSDCTGMAATDGTDAIWIYLK